MVLSFFNESIADAESKSSLVCLFDCIIIVSYHIVDCSTYLFSCLPAHLAHLTESLRSDPHNRWLTPYEALLCQSFPVLKSLCYGLSVTSFSDDLTDDADPNADVVLSQEDSCEISCVNITTSASGPDSESGRTARIGQAGNAMHAQMVGVALLHVLSCGATPSREFQKLNSSLVNTAVSARVQSSPAQCLTPKLRQLCAMIKGTHGS